MTPVGPRTHTETVGDITQADATGVAKYHGFQERMANAVRDRESQRTSAEAVADGDSGDDEPIADDGDEPS